MTTKVTGHTFLDSGTFEPINSVVDGFENFNLHRNYAWSGLEVEDASATDEAAHFKITGINPEALSQVIVQFNQEGHALDPKPAMPEKLYILPENLTARIIGITTEQGTPVLSLSYERPASTHLRDRR